MYMHRDKERNFRAQKCTRHMSLEFNENYRGILNAQKGH